jgi:hypothetical protein
MVLGDNRMGMLGILGWAEDLQAAVVSAAAAPWMLSTLHAVATNGRLRAHQPAQ